ncbi:hypothetical protein E4U40_004816 [Claviceps sp. LM458 group G5]|nr:hypothetical protein E4U40_004816 [Claviceps sp. LM458 group G5]
MEDEWKEKQGSTQMKIRQEARGRLNWPLRTGYGVHPDLQARQQSQQSQQSQQKPAEGDASKQEVAVMTSA